MKRKLYWVFEYKRSGEFQERGTRHDHEVSKKKCEPKPGLAALSEVFLEGHRAGLALADETACAAASQEQAKEWELAVVV